MGSMAAGAGRFISGFFGPMGENRLGVGRGPAVGQHLLQTRVVGIEAEQKLADVTPRLDPMTLDFHQHHLPSHDDEISSTAGTGLAGRAGWMRPMRCTTVRLAL